MEQLLLGLIVFFAFRPLVLAQDASPSAIFFNSDTSTAIGQSIHLLYIFMSIAVFSIGLCIGNWLLRR